MNRTYNTGDHVCCEDGYNFYIGTFQEMTSHNEYVILVNTIIDKNTCDITELETCNVRYFDNCFHL